MERPPTPDHAKATTSVPTLLKQGTSYKVYDPELLAGTKHDLDAEGRLIERNAAMQGLLAILGVVASTIAAPVFLADGQFWSTLLWAVGGGAAGLVVLVIVIIALPDPMRDYRKRHGQGDPFVDVEEGDFQAVRLCRLAEDVASSDAWRQQRIDPDRLMPATLWSAVRLSLRITQLQERLVADQRRGASENVLAPTREEIASGTSDVEHVETNLREIGRLAREIDARAAIPARASATMTSGSLGDSSGEADIAVAGSDAILAHSRALRDLL